MGDLKDLTVEGFVDVTASDAPAPGGGAVSALAGALAAKTCRDGSEPDGRQS